MDGVTVAEGGEDDKDELIHAADVRCSHSRHCVTVLYRYVYNARSQRDATDSKL